MVVISDSRTGWRVDAMPSRTPDREDLGRSGSNARSATSRRPTTSWSSATRPDRPPMHRSASRTTSTALAQADPLSKRPRLSGPRRSRERPDRRDVHRSHDLGVSDLTVSGGDRQDPRVPRPSHDDAVRAGARAVPRTDAAQHRCGDPRLRPGLLEIPELTPEAIRTAAASIDPAFTHSPQYVNDGLRRPDSASRSWSGRDGEPVRSFRAAARGSRSVGWRGGEDRPGATGRRRIRGQLRAGRGLRCTGAGSRGRVRRATPPDEGRPDGALGATVLEEGEDFDDARGASEQFAIETGAELLVDGDDPRIAQGAASWRLKSPRASRRAPCHRSPSLPCWRQQGR